MTVKELIEHLKTFDENLEVIYDLYSDYHLLKVEDVDVIECLDTRKDGWITRYYDRQHSSTPPNLKKFAHFPGN